MAAINPQARSFVNLIVSGYDGFCHKDTPNIPDIFNPELQEGLKESSLEHFSEMFSNPPLVEKSDPQKKTDVQLDADVVTKPPLVEKSYPMTYVELNAEVVAKYKERGPTLSHLFALTGILDTHLQKGLVQGVKDRIFPILGLANSSQDDNLEKTKEHIIEVLVQDHLREKDYKLDPLTSLRLIESKSHFYGQIFLEVYSRSSVRNKRKIVALLKDFQPQLESRSFKFQRVVFKIEGVFNRIITNEHIKFVLGLAFYVGSWRFGVDNVVVLKLIALSGVFFNSAAFVGISSGVVSYLPSLIVQISRGTYNGLVGTVVYVASTRLGEWVPFVITKLYPLTRWIFYPVTTFVRTCYQWAFGPSARAQAAIAESLKSKDPKVAQELLDGGMKAYQIWMCLVEQGPRKGFFEVVSATK